MNLALFDLDNTLLDGDSDFAWAQFLMQKGVLDRAAQEEKNRRFLADYEAGTLDIEAFLAFQLAPLARYPRATLLSWRAEFIKTVGIPMILDSARALVREHLAAGDLCVLVTATNSFVTEPIAEALEISHLIATIPECAEGQFTGRVKGIPAFRAGKVVRVEDWLEARARCWSDFGDSWFYSDSHNDLPLMEKVSRPTAVNPDARLKEIARHRQWPVLRLRRGTQGDAA
ncbi:MAG: HAD-IB family hydrolase [Zoogloeaceae bacterium]|jgi:HAD superfamily hydrolase (TIGR01490 family)|nr:HAD-IB family hydrolase [Zoogloeaceae bacterium]